MSRKVLFTANTGSWNYNLQDETSDRDYKEFVCPSFDDLYYNNMFSDSIITERVDKEIHDIRKLPELLFKSNISYLETLFSDEIIACQEIRDLVRIRNLVATINLPQLYKTCKGMYFNRLKRIDKSTIGTKDLIQEFGYNTKEAMHAYRTLDFIIRFALTGFRDFEAAIKYQDYERGVLLSIKQGAYKKEDLLSLFDFVYNNEFLKLEHEYMTHRPNLKLKKHLDDIVHDLVARELNIK
ncbi:nucleotidyltransferase domain-containing protein (plasmid) [Bacillus velezensis]|uniref:DNA polymerase beta superfamily protein n=1 Tax=Bacillus velezensis TaxID=492670 RepID=UPI000B324B00|nr:nucleotidyltransferase domain-containing protein [Bacillus velezensis]URJ76367.1 nucleotidyltransferase domain-containing protein [Bacillus velezensis]URJ80487.1 nucleotidyltransferase domain-containing protein [Bacillus velezensis]